MKASTIKQRSIRLIGITGLTLGLALSTGVAAAMPSPSGLTECEHAGCAIVSTTSSTQRSLAVHSSAQVNTGGVLGPHLTR